MKIASWFKVPVAAALNRRKTAQEVCDSLGPAAEPLPSIIQPELALDLKAPTLRRPVLLVHGLAQQADTWVNMKNYLCSNPENPYGGVYRPGQDVEFYTEQLSRPFPGKVFILNLTDNLASPAENGKEVSEAISKIRGATGSGQVDVITHSMGAYQARQALQDGEDAMANLIMISPPNQGAYGADLLLKLDKLGLGRYPENGALESLRADGDYVRALNATWEQDRQRLQSATIISGVGLPTPDKTWKLASNGDGMVAAERAQLGDTPMFVAADNGLPAGHPDFRDFQMFRYNHLQIVSEAEVYQKVGQILGRKPADSSPAENYGEQLVLDESIFKQPATVEWPTRQDSLF
ncbi:hypothetical protein JST97_21415 [bacterium]|nr:hypothetical protein [bacterium]